MDECYKCVTQEAHPIHDDGTVNEEYEGTMHQIDWYKEAREAMEERRDVRDKG